MGAVNGSALSYTERLNDVHCFIPQVIKSTSTGYILLALGLRVKHLLSFANDYAARHGFNEAFLDPRMGNAKRVYRAECF